ncbi:MAG TPA: TetR/AcrR family transcriptional regulator [Eoetvoesiella sp.]
MSLCCLNNRAASHKPQQLVVAEDSHQTIVLAACELIAEQGFGAMSMRALAHRAGFQPGSLYHHFSCKQEVLEEVAEHLLGERIHEWWSCRPNSKKPLDMLNAFVTFHIDRLHNQRAEEQLLCTELRYLNPGRRERVQEHYSIYVRELDIIIESGIERGAFSLSHGAGTSHAILAMLDGLVCTRAYSFDADARSIKKIQGMVARIVGCPFPD